MCHALLEVTYQHNTAPQELIKLIDEADFKVKLAKFQAMELVEKIVLFSPETTYTRITSWSKS